MAKAEHRAETDAAMANDIRLGVDNLNRAVAAAVAAGLKVTFESVTITDCDRPGSGGPNINAIIARTVSL